MKPSTGTAQLTRQEFFFFFFFLGGGMVLGVIGNGKGSEVWGRGYAPIPIQFLMVMKRCSFEYISMQF